jgi:hypothetical protein
VLFADCQRKALLQNSVFNGGVTVQLEVELIKR